MQIASWASKDVEWVLQMGTAWSICYNANFLKKILNHFDSEAFSCS